MITVRPVSNWLERLRLTRFRGYADAEVVARDGLVVVTGDNGAGKTNLLEAVSLLAPGRGLRGAGYSEIAQLGGGGGWGIAATLGTAAGPVELGTGTQASAPERRLARINGAASSVSGLGEWLSLVWLTPAMDRLFSDTPGARRRFLDRLVLALHPGHGTQVTRYEAAMRQRSRLLASDDAEPAWLDALERAMAEHGAALSAARTATVAALVETLAAAPAGPFARPLLTLAGPGTDVAATLRRNRRADAASGRATFGPHRDDLAVAHAASGMPAARASTGEQKALLIAIVLAHAALVAARTGRAPLLLLDEITAHLDAERRAALFERLAATATQVWMTGTDAALFAAADAATRLTVVGGHIAVA